MVVGRPDPFLLGFGSFSGKITVKLHLLVSFRGIFPGKIVFIHILVQLTQIFNTTYILPIGWLYGCFLKWWHRQIIHFNRGFHYKPSILGVFPLFLETSVCYLLVPPFWGTTETSIELSQVMILVDVPPNQSEVLVSLRDVGSGSVLVEDVMKNSWNLFLGQVKRCFLGENKVCFFF